MLFAGAQAHAESVIYSNLPVDPGNFSGGWVIAGPNSSLGDGQVHIVAVSFTPTTDFLFTQIDAAIGFIDGSSSSETLSLVADDGTGAPDLTSAPIDTWTVTLSPWDATSLVTVLNTKVDPLTAGTQYWIEASAQGDTFAAWDISTQGDKGPILNDAGVNTNVLGAFDVMGNAVVAGQQGDTPEPATLATTLGGGLLLLLVGARRRTGSRGI